ncbi:unnamed protein product [Gongylonema pulchrum]|uniref:Uncharacterized protein n=1 Tax=Gongylonema pulchrum TaxID=637853 RepID=A0A3P7NML4_9BILA|nr:unnamed protein product [Gongylonema pulchrum]
MLDRVVERISSLLDRTQNLHENWVRGPYLARLAFFSRMLDAGLMPCNLLGTLGLGCVTVVFRLELFDQHVLTISFYEASGVTTDAHWADIVYQRIRRGLGMHENLSPVEKRQTVNYLVKMMNCCSDSDLAATGYAHLAANLLWDLYVEKSGNFLLIFYFCTINTETQRCSINQSRWNNWPAYPIDGAVMRFLHSFPRIFIATCTVFFS